MICMLALVPAFAVGCSCASASKWIPAEVAALTDRITNCNHWLGEYPYDLERAGEIEAAVLELRCGDIEGEKAAILERFRKNQEVLRVIGEAEEAVW